MAANVPTPDSILDQSRRTKTQLTPAAQHVSTYRAPTRDDVPEPPQENMVSQLGAALSKMSGTMTQATAYAKTLKDQQDLAAGEAMSRELQAKNITRIDEAVKSGLLPAGASPVFMNALRDHQLGAAAANRKRSLQAAYWSDENAAIRNSDDPDKFMSFVKSHNEAFDQGVLLDKDGSKVYSDLDLHRAKFHEKGEEDINALYREHLSYRVGEHEKQAEQVAGQRATHAIEDGLDKGLTHAEIAPAVNAIFRDPTSGLVTHGMKASKQTEIVVDAIVDAAINRRDIKVLDLVDNMPTDNPKAFLGGTSYARKKIEAARLHITHENWLEGERNRTMAERRGAGIATDPEAEARQKEIRERHELEYSVKVKQLSQQSNALDKAAQAEPEQAAIIGILTSGGSAFDHEVVGHMKNLGRIDPTAAQQMFTFLQGQQLKQKTAHDEKATLDTYTRLRAQLSTDPAKFDRGLIVMEANRGNLTSGQVSSLFENAEAQSKAAKEYPVLQSDIVKQMRSDIRAASMTNPLDEFGAGRLRADSASNEFNDLVLDYVRTHPTAGAYEISKAMRPEVERLARRHNAELDQTMNQNENRKKTEEMYAQQAAARAKRELEFSQKKPLTAAEKRARLEGKK